MRFAGGLVIESENDDLALSLAAKDRPAGFPELPEIDADDFAQVFVAHNGLEIGWEPPLGEDDQVYIGTVSHDNIFFWPQSFYYDLLAPVP